MAHAEPLDAHDIARRARPAAELVEASVAGAPRPGPIAKLAATQKKKPRGDQTAQRAFAAGELAGQEEARVDAVLVAAEKSYTRFARSNPFW